jgi:hypothetical protein
MKWHEKEKRQENSLSVSTMINDDVLERHSINTVDCRRFLAVNELTFRVTYDIEEHHETGLFRNLFEYTVRSIKK